MNEVREFEETLEECAGECGRTSRNAKEGERL